MAGVDTVRGIAYQQAQAVIAAIDVLDSDDLGILRVEGNDDVVDIEVFTQDGTLTHGKQVKTRQTQYTWGQAELLEIMARWATLPNAENASFEFLTDGRLGPTGEAVRDALQQAARGEKDSLAQLLGKASDSRECAILANARICVDSTTSDGVLLRAQNRVVAMLPDARTAADATAIAETSVLRLHQLLFTRASEAKAANRLVRRAEIADALGVPADQPSDKRWPGTLRYKYITAAREPSSEIIVEPMLQPVKGFSTRTDGTVAEQAKVPDLLQGKGAVILVGRTGTGKSTTAEVLRQKGAIEDVVVLLAHAETYVAGRVQALASDAIANVLGYEVPMATGQQALFDRSVVLVIDGASEIPAEHRRALQEDLRTLVASGRGARVMLLGRDIATVREILPASLTPTTYMTADLSREQRVQLGKKVADRANLDGNAEGEKLVARVEYSLQEAAGNPILFRMGLELVAEGWSFSNRATLYAGSIERLAAQYGATNLTYVLACLGVAFTRLLDLGKRYADPFEWDLLLRAVLDDLQTPESISSEFVNSTARRIGLIGPMGYSQTVVPIHDSFADYLSGKAYATRLIPFPERLSSVDDQRVLFAAELGCAGYDLAKLVVRDRPFLLPRMASFDEQNLGDDAPDHAAAMLSQLTGKADLAVALHRRTDGAVAAFYMSGGSSGWVGTADARELATTRGAAIVNGGLSAVVTRLWRNWVRSELNSERGVGSPHPAGLVDAVALLEAHVSEVSDLVDEYIAAIAPPGHTEQLAAAVGPAGLNAVVEAGQDDRWPVYYRAADGVEVSVQHAPVSVEIVEQYGGRSDIRYFLSKSAKQQAAAKILDAINDLTIPHWIRLH